MSSEVKQLIIVAEGTAALGPYWEAIVSDYLEKIIRSFCGSELNGERNSVSTVELSLVIFNTRGSYCDCVVQRSSWTRDVDTFLHWLSCIQFCGGGVSEVATAEGLAEALMMFSPPSGQAQPSNDLKRHCILVTASNPHPLTTPVYRPGVQNVERNENRDGQSESSLSDAETVASYFSKCSFSLSVVCPRQLPKIKALYNAGKLNPQSVDLSIDTVKNKFYLVLISENFVEARAALGLSATSLPQTQSPVKMDRATVAPSLPVTRKPPSPMTSANGPILNRQPVSVGPVLSATVTVEPTVITSTASVPSFPHTPTVARPATQAIPSIQTSSASPVSQDIVINTEAPDAKPLVGGKSSSSGALQTSQSKSVKFWEGDLAGTKQGKRVLITRLQGYRRSSASDSLAANWPRTMQIVRLISQDHLNKINLGKADFLEFGAMYKHGFLEQLQEKKLCAVIQLPSQTLLLRVSSHKVYRLIGMLFPGDMVVITPQISNQQTAAATTTPLPTATNAVTAPRSSAATAGSVDTASTPSSTAPGDVASESDAEAAAASRDGNGRSSICSSPGKITTR